MIKPYVKSHITKIKSIHPDSLNYEDLHLLGRAIGNARIVMLGEADHGDALSFAAKSRIIKYLHQVHGFDVLIFEGDFYSLNKKSDLITSETTLDSSYFADQLFKLWSKCNTTADLLYRYIPQTFRESNPLMVGGIDCQLYSTFSKATIKPEVLRYLERNNIPFVHSRKYSDEFVPLFDSVLFGVTDSLEQLSFMNNLDVIRKELDLINKETEFGYMTIQNIRQLTCFRHNRKYNTTSPYGNILEIRDQQMAENLKWLTRYKYPDKKIIVWAHNGHIIKKEGHHSMGYILQNDSSFKISHYILGFTSRDGTYSNPFYSKGEIKTMPPIPNKFCFENWIPDKYNFAFVDFTEYTKTHTHGQDEFYMKVNQNIYFSEQWTNGFDGIFYIKEMSGCE